MTKHPFAPLCALLALMLLAGSHTARAQAVDPPAPGHSPTGGGVPPPPPTIVAPPGTQAPLNLAMPSPPAIVAPPAVTALPGSAMPGEIAPVGDPADICRNLPDDQRAQLSLCQGQ